MYNYVLMRDEKEERKQARSIKQTRQSNTAHPLFPYKKNELPQVGFEPTTLYTLDSSLPCTELPRQLSWLGPNVHLCHQCPQLIVILSYARGEQPPQIPVTINNKFIIIIIILASVSKWHVIIACP